MKALSINPQPAMAIYTGEKTIEWRSWNTNHRGDLLICGTARKQAGGISGHAFYYVDLIDVVPFTRKYLKDACMANMPDPPGYAWIFGEDIITLHPVEVKGQQGLFEVDDDKLLLLCGGETDDLSDDEFDAEFQRRFDAEITPLIYKPAEL